MKCDIDIYLTGHVFVSFTPDNLIFYHSFELIRESSVRMSNIAVIL